MDDVGARWSGPTARGRRDSDDNAAWQDGRLVGFFDWDFAAPVTPEWDLAFTAFAWAPLACPAPRGGGGGVTAFDDASAGSDFSSPPTPTHRHPGRR